MSFLDNFPAAEITEALGDAMTYYPIGGVPISGHGMIRFDVERVGAESYITELVNTVEWPRALFSDPQRGDELTIRGQTYRVESREKDNGIFIRVVVR